jgi:tetratricopeptide (TPR) repeat protein
MGRHNDALAETRRALELDPTSLMTNFAMGWALISARQYDQTIALFQRALEIDPRFAGAPHFIGTANVGRRMFGEAVTEFWKALRLQPDNILFKAQLGFALARVRRTQEAEAILADFNASTAQRYVSPY